MRKQIYYLVICSLLLISCATTPKPIYPTVSNFIGSRDLSKYSKIAVLPFSDAPGASQSGQIIQGLSSQIFAQYGFKVAERARLFNILSEQKLSQSGLMDTAQSIQIGKLLGVNAIVLGEVGQYSVIQRKTDTTYFPLILYGQTSYIPIQGKQWMESYVSISLRVIDVETSQLIYSGSGQYDQGLTNPPQQLAEYILRDIIGKWVISAKEALKNSSIRNELLEIVMTSSEAIRHNPDNVENYFRRSVAHLKLGEYDQAMGDMDMIINLNPKAAFAYAGRSFIYLIKRDYPKAIKEANIALKINPQSSFGYYNRGRAYIEMGNFKDGTDDLINAARFGNKSSQSYLKAKGIEW